jgi:hypothetical protein
MKNINYGYADIKGLDKKQREARAHILERVCESEAINVLGLPAKDAPQIEESHQIILNKIPKDVDKSYYAQIEASEFYDSFL